MTIEKQGLPEGAYMNKYMDGRFKRNKNILVVITGSTGSGKTYSALKICEDWYKFRFNKDFPIENICFSVEEVVKRLKDRALQKSELLLLEEAGANLGASDFQQKLSKIFTYILQSFRSMNIGLIMTLPVLSMLNKQARQLLHIHMITEGIVGDKCKLKIKMHQLNQHTGKSYWKAPHIAYNNMYEKMPFINCSLATQELRNNYEKKKESFVYGLVDGFEDKTKTREQTRAEERKKEIERLKKRDVWLGAHIKDKNNKLKCVMCGRSSIEAGINYIKCRLCAHIEPINIE
jgi:hypothetical protein